MRSLRQAETTPHRLQSVIDRVVTGHLRTISRCISWIENAEPDALEIVAALEHLAGRTTVIGVTGIPGAGKSTLVPALARRLAKQGRKPAILAVDPSSPLTGGAILGDRIRENASEDYPLFFRSMASRGGPGGLSRAVEDVITLLDAAGFDAILVETVGTGQSDVLITRVADTTITATAPGLGDEIQAMKAGILEVADLVVINKLDADPSLARVAAETIRTTLSLSQHVRGLQEGANAAKADRPAAWLPPVRAVSALKGDGLDDLVTLLDCHRQFLAETGLAAARRRSRRLERFQEHVSLALAARAAALHADAFRTAAQTVDAGCSPLKAAEELARKLITAGGKSKNKGEA